VRRELTALCAGTLLALSAEAQQGPLTLGAGFHYSSGDYGTSSTTDIASLAATAKYDAGPWTYRATVPYIKIDGDNAVIPGVGRVGGGSGTRTESGLGDIVLGATYAAYSDARRMRTKDWALASMTSSSWSISTSRSTASLASAASAFTSWATRPACRSTTCGA